VDAPEALLWTSLAAGGLCGHEKDSIHLAAALAPRFNCAGAQDTEDTRRKHRG